MAKKQTQTEESAIDTKLVSLVARAIAGDADYETLVGLALSAVSSRMKPGSTQVRIADVLIAMRRIKCKRDLMQLLLAMAPTRNNFESILGAGVATSPAEIAFVFGASEATVVNQWIPAGMPVEE